MRIIIKSTWESYCEDYEMTHSISSSKSSACNADLLHKWSVWRSPVCYHVHSHCRESSIFQDRKKNAPCRRISVEWLMTTSLSKGFDPFTWCISLTALEIQRNTYVFIDHIIYEGVRCPEGHQELWKVSSILKLFLLCRERVIKTRPYKIKQEAKTPSHPNKEWEEIRESKGYS